MKNNFIILATNGGGVIVSKRILIGPTPEGFELAKSTLERIHAKCSVSFFSEQELEEMIRSIEQAKPKA